MECQNEKNEEIRKDKSFNDNNSKAKSFEETSEEETLALILRIKQLEQKLDKVDQKLQLSEEKYKSLVESLKQDQEKEIARLSDSEVSQKAKLEQFRKQLKKTTNVLVITNDKLKEVSSYYENLKKFTGELESKIRIAIDKHIFLQKIVFSCEQNFELQKSAWRNLLYQKDIDHFNKQMQTSEVEQKDEALNQMKKIQYGIHKNCIEEGMKIAICPISQEIMEDPVMTPEGINYDRKSIETWIELKQKDPILGSPLAKKDLIPNRALRDIIGELVKLANYDNNEKKQINHLKIV